MLTRYTWESQKKKLQYYKRRQPEASALYQIVFHGHEELPYVWESVRLSSRPKPDSSISTAAYETWFDKLTTGGHQNPCRVLKLRNPRPWGR